MGKNVPRVEIVELTPDLSLVIPCYNEAAVLHNTITRLAQSFQAKGVKAELLLVDNGSEDATGEIINKLIQEGLPVFKETVEVNQGYGNGILRGLPLCRGRFVGFSCADGQVEAEDVVKLYEIASHAKFPKLVKVRRRFRMDGFRRKVISIIYNVVANIMFGGLGSIDINGNPKILPRQYLERMNLESKDWFLDPEVMIKAKRLGLGVFEMNVIAQMREGGSSHVHSTTCWEFLVNLLRYRFVGRGRIQRNLRKTPECENLLVRGE
jgi:glycosyltransferase involved in cell wall biosynthesis